MTSITRWVEPVEPQQRERRRGAGAVGQTEREWSQLIAMLELAQRWEELIGEFTDEDAHPDGCASRDFCQADTVAS